MLLCAARAALGDDALVTFEGPGGDGVLRVLCAEPIVASGWSLLVDHQDVTALAALSESRREVRIERPQTPGEHRVIFTATTDGGLQLRREFEFAAEQTSFGGYALFDAEAGAAPAKSGDALSDQRYYLDGALYNETHWQRANWTTRFSAQANLSDHGVARYPLHDGRPVVPQLLLQTGYSDAGRGAMLELGDMVIDATPFIAQNLARRGGQLRADAARWSANLFSLNGDPALSFEDGTGLGVTTERNLHGVTGEYRWRDATYWLRGAYLSGGRANTGLGVAGTLGASEGQAAGMVFGLRPWGHGATVELEHDRSRYDPDTSDAQDARDDSASALRLRGFEQRWSYAAAVERIGPDYGAVGNETLRGDRAAVSLDGRYGAETYSAALRASAAHDNVDDDAARPRVTTRSVGADYSYAAFPGARLVLRAATTALDSSREPAAVLPQKVNTHEFGAQWLQRARAWELGVLARRAVQDDRYDDINDTRSRTLGLTPAYRRRALYVAPALTLTTIDSESGNGTRVESAALVVQGSAWRERVVYAWYGAYNTVDAEASGDTDFVYHDARVSYRMNHSWPRRHTSLTGLRWQMVNGDGGAAAGNEQGWVVWLTYAVNAPWVY
jgi:hypothetical protein